MKTILSRLLALSITTLLLAACSSKPEAESAEAAVETVPDEPHDIAVVVEGRDNMTFDKVAFEVTEGQRVKLVFKNVGSLPKQAMGHNLVILVPGSDVAAFGNEAVKYFKDEYIPTDEAFSSQVVAHTKLLGPKEQDVIYFTAGSPGAYPFICSFPAHYAVMQGVMTVKAK